MTFFAATFPNFVTIGTNRNNLGGVIDGFQDTGGQHCAVQCDYFSDKARWQIA